MYFDQWYQVSKYRVCPGTNANPVLSDLRAKPVLSYCRMWAMLIEKAFAKMYGGYDRLEGGHVLLNGENNALDRERFFQ